VVCAIVERSSGRLCDNGKEPSGFSKLWKIPSSAERPPVCRAHAAWSHICVIIANLYLKTNSVALISRANSTDWATVTFRWNLVPTFLARRMSRGQRGGSLTVVNLSFLDRSRYLSFK
jgi:hypothetical protein